MADLLNGIIRKGGTTAFVDEIDRNIVLGWFDQAPNRSVWQLAEDDSGDLLGFQSIEPHSKLPHDACDIATFVQVGQTGIGIGSKLFEASKQVAIDLGYRWINATIRADNRGGLAYYQSRGFEDYARHPNVALGNGQRVDWVRKRYDLP
jgi:L-amino acid N-acyltransferase YncA